MTTPGAEIPESTLDAQSSVVDVQLVREVTRAQSSLALVFFLAFSASICGEELDNFGNCELLSCGCGQFLTP